jgi:hypothetical protein
MIRKGNLKRCAWIWAVLWVVVATVGACAPKPTEEGLRKRVEAAWNAKVRGDWAAVYEMCSDNFKQHTDKGRFASAANLKVKRFEIDKVEMDASADPARAKVTIKAEMNPMGFELKGVRITEDWIFEDGEWRLDINPKRNPITG